MFEIIAESNYQYQLKNNVGSSAADSRFYYPFNSYTFFVNY